VDKVMVISPEESFFFVAKVRVVVFAIRSTRHTGMCHTCK